MRDVKDMIGAIMCVLDGAEIPEDEIVDLAFDADGKTAGCAKRSAIAHDRERRIKDSHFDQEARTTLQRVLNEVARLSMRNPDAARLVVAAARCSGAGASRFCVGHSCAVGGADRRKALRHDVPGERVW